MTRRPQLLLFFGAALLLSATSGVHESIFNNFLADTFAMEADERGFLELPREMPGFLVVLVAGFLALLPETKIAVVGALVFAAGMCGLGWLGSSFGLMLTFMVLGSVGMHLLQPIVPSIAIALSDENTRGRRLGQVGAISKIGFFVGACVIWLLFDDKNPAYRWGFFIGAGIAVLGAIVYASMHLPNLQQPKPRFVFRKKYGLFYLLHFLFGARKQIFITFGPWVLITVYHEPAANVARLFAIASFIGIFFAPATGWAIDRFGERRVMIADGILLAFVCLGYGYAAALTGDAESARPIARVCFVLDDLLFALGGARSVYLSRLTKSPQEITSSLAMGVSINHIASMTIPMFAGAMWLAFGYERVFLGAAMLALCIAAVSSRVPSRSCPLESAP